MLELAGIIILGLIFYLSFSLLAQDNGFSGEKPGNQATGEQKTGTVSEGQTHEDPLDMEDEDYVTEDQDVFSSTRKLFQKKFDPLTQQEEIIWAFRLSDTDTFL